VCTLPLSCQSMVRKAAPAVCDVSHTWNRILCLKQNSRYSSVYMEHSKPSNPVGDKIRQFFTAFPTRRYAKNDIILFAYDEVPPIHYLVSGHVAQYDLSDEARKNILTIYKPGAFFPMAGAIAGTPNKYFFEALDAVTLHLAPAEKAAEFVQSNPDVAYDLLSRLYRGMDGLLNRMSLLMDGTADKRLLLELQIMGDRFGTRTETGETLIKVTELQLSAQSGLARETVSRQLKKLAEAGTISQQRGSIILKKV